MNISDLITTLNEKVNITSSSQDLLYLCKALEKLNVGNITVVDTFTNLPIGIITEGSVAFVDDENKLYFFRSGWREITSELFLTEVWGCGGSGVIDFTGVARSSPVRIGVGPDNWLKFDGAFSGLTTDGKIYTKFSRILPQFEDWIDFDRGATESRSNNCLAIRSNGTMWAVGINSSGELGDGTRIHRSSPVSVIGGFTDWISAAHGSSHSLGVRSNGTLWGWGSGANGQLCEITGFRSSPSQITTGGFTDWASVSAGSECSFAIRKNATAWSWGVFGSGQLGTGNVVSTSSPSQISGNWKRIIINKHENSGSSSFHGGISTTNDGFVWGWGYFGNLGNFSQGVQASRSTPFNIGSNVASIAFSQQHTIRVGIDGGVAAAGWNGYGSLGTSERTHRSTFVGMAGSISNAVFAGAGSGGSFIFRRIDRQR
jgi:hypothetical protein